jgi:hypothetical protein
MDGKFFPRVTEKLRAAIHVGDQSRDIDNGDGILGFLEKIPVFFFGLPEGVFQSHPLGDVGVRP